MRTETFISTKMTETLNSYHSMYASLSAEITAHIGKISVLAREESGDKSGELLCSSCFDSPLTFKTGIKNASIFAQISFRVWPFKATDIKRPFTVNSCLAHDFHHMEFNSCLLQSLSCLIHPKSCNLFLLFNLCSFWIVFRL